MYTVYKHTCPNGKVYIGITKQKPERRWGGNGIGYKENEYFYRAIQKYGWNNIKHEIIAEGLTEDEANEMEIDLISQYRANDRSRGYNKHYGGKVHDTVSLSTLLKNDYLPYEVIKGNATLNEIFEKLITAALGTSFKETTVTHYYGDGEIVKTETRETVRDQKPSYFALCLLLSHYSDSERIKPLIPTLSKLKQEIEEDI